MSCGSFIIFEEVVTPSGSAPITRRDVPRPVFTQRWICGMTERARCLLIVVRTREDPKCPSTEGWSLTLGTSSLQTCVWRPVPCRRLRDRQSGAHTFTCGITAMMKVFTSRERAGDRPSGQSLRRHPWSQEAGFWLRPPHSRSPLCAAWQCRLFGQDLMETRSHDLRALAARPGPGHSALPILVFRHKAKV